MSEAVEATVVSSTEGSLPPPPPPPLTTTGTTTTTTTRTSTTSGTTLESRDVTESSPPPPPPLPPPPRTSTKTATPARKHKKHVFTHNRYNLYDGKKIRSALIHKKWPPKPRKVSFPTSDNDLVTGYLEPANPWEHAENLSIEDLISSYKKSCERHCTEPLPNVVSQLEKLDISEDERCAELCMKNECLDQYHCEPLEEILKRVQFEKIDVEAASLDDESAVILFDMTEYYQSARHLNMSNNRNIGSRGWQACAHMIKKTTCLEQLEARDITLTQQHMNILKRPLQLVSHLHILKLENCGLAGRAFGTLVSALKLNTGLKELYLADNGLEQEDAIQLGALLRVNNHLQLLDISNNHIKDEGVGDLLHGLITQSSDDRRGGRGLNILVLWNNDLTKGSSAHFAQAIAQSITLETLNIGKNSVSNELLEWSEEALVKSNTLLQLGMQSTNVTCKGALILAEILEKNRTLQRIDLRDNNIQMEGLTALSFAMKRNTSVTQMDLDDKPWSTTPATMHQYLDLVAEIRGYCVRNDEPTSTDDSTEESSSPQHRSRLSSVSSRKISLTCQTLPRSPPSMTPTSNEIANRAMLEPKRTSGRLRSPAPSPIPSPVASPIPSPSRGRFVVSRVSEASLSSTNSSASSSPVTPPSLASSPTCFFPSAGGRSSRFRVVTVVEPAAAAAAAATSSVVTSTNANVTIGFNYRVQTPENNDSDDSDSVFRSDNRAAGGDESSASIDIHVSFEEETNTVLSVKSAEKDTSPEGDLEHVKQPDNKAAINIPEEETPKVEDNHQTDSARSVNEESRARSVNGEVTEETEPTKTSVEERRVNDSTEESLYGREIGEPKKIDRVEPEIIIETKVHSEKRPDESLRDEIIASLRSEPKKSESVQRQATSLEKLIGLFQHPGSIFSGGSYAVKTDAKNPLQDGVNSMIALGDKFQQYLGRTSGKPGSEDSPSHAPLQRSVSDASRSTIKLDPVKSLSIPQLSSIQAICTRDFVSCKEATKVVTENSGDISQLVETTAAESTTRLIFVDKNTPARSAEEEISPRICDDLSLPENVQSTVDDKGGDADILDVSSKDAISAESRDVGSTENVNNSMPSVVAESKSTICAPKLKDIPENSVLELRGSQVDIVTSDESSSRNNDEDKNLDDDDAATKCDSSTTDSINDPSFKYSSLCKITCDISGADDVHTLGTTDDVHNFLNAPLSHHREPLEEQQTITFASSETIVLVEGPKSPNDENENPNINPQENPEDAISKDEKDETISRTAESSRPVRAVVANNVELPVFNNFSENHPIEAKDMNAQDQVPVVPETRFDDIRSMVTEDFEFSDTVEEFLPIDMAAAAAPTAVSSTLPLQKLVAPVLTNNCVNNNSLVGDSVTITRQELHLVMSVEREGNNAQDESTSTALKDEHFPSANQTVTEEGLAISDRVSVPNADRLTNEFFVNKIEIASIIEDDDSVPAPIEQVSTSLSEDSDYSSKLSVDDIRTSEPSLIDSTANSPAHDRIVEMVADTSLTSNSLDCTNRNETSINTTEQRSLVRVAVETVLTSIMNVTESAGRVSEIKNSESTEDLMFKMTDISTEISPNVNQDALFEPGQSSRSPTNLLIDKSRKVHRNSQDSGIEEATVSISEDSGIESNGQPRESFQESVDSGIDSECSSVCARVDVGADVQKERARDPGKISSVDLSVTEEIRGFSGSHSRIMNDPIYKSLIEDKKSSAELAQVIGVGRSVEAATTDRSGVVVRSTSPE